MCDELLASFAAAAPIRCWVTGAMLSEREWLAEVVAAFRAVGADDVAAFTTELIGECLC